MQVTSATYDQHAQADVRPLSWGLSISFDKTIDPSITFFILDTSLLDGPDVLMPDASYSNVVQQWDKYLYTDYSDRVVSLEWQREESTPYSVNQAMADVVLNNYDDYFSPGSGSPISADILPRRPIRINAGFGGNNIPAFVGLTEGMPEIDERSKTASFHCIDFLSYLFSRPLTEAVIYQDMRTDEIIDALFQVFGLSSSQYVLDVGFNLIPFAYFEKDSLLGEALKQLMEAELGSLYMDEAGIIHFKNRQIGSLAPVYSFSGATTADITTPNEDDIINVVQIEVNARSVQDLQPIYQLGESINILPGDSVEVWADFQDPVISCHDPVLGFAADESYMRAYLTSDTESTEVLSDVNVTSSYLFAVSYKVTIQNNNAFPIYINEMELWGEPAKVTTTINERFADDASVLKYEEHTFNIENNLIQTSYQAASVGLTILQYFSEYGDIAEGIFKGNMALQIADPISINAGSFNDIFLITKYQNEILAGGFRQSIKSKKNFALSFFILDVSLLDGPDVMSP